MQLNSGRFGYEKGKVIQALRYHFISRREIKLMLILVNVFAILSASLFFLHKVSPLAFLISTILWIALMLTFWYILPVMIFRRSQTFQDHFKVLLNEQEFTLSNDAASRSWGWNDFSAFMESPHFFHLYFDQRSFLIIPKEAFTADDQASARGLLRKHIRS